MVKPEDKDSSEDDEDMNSEPGASSAPAEPASFRELMARDSNIKTAANTVSQTSIPDGEGKGDEEATRRDWNFENEEEDGDQEDSFLLPPSQKFRPSSIDHLDEQMRLLTWMQYHPSPMDEPTRTLAEMVSAPKAIPRREAERLMDMGDGNMLMPIAMFEHYVYPMT
jgi:hypothetical protein